jgi:hypothetical protein
MVFHSLPEHDPIRFVHAKAEACGVRLRPNKWNPFDPGEKGLTH